MDQQLPGHGERLPAEAPQPLFSLLTTGMEAAVVWTLSELLSSQNLLGRARGSGEGEGAIGSWGGAQWLLLCIVQARLSLKHPGLAPNSPALPESSLLSATPCCQVCPASLSFKANCRHKDFPDNRASLQTPHSYE